MSKIFDGSKLRNLRKELRYTLEQMATMLNTSASYLSDIENNRSNPGLELLINLRKVMGIDLNNFLAEDLVWKVAEQQLNYNVKREKLNEETLEKVEALAKEILLIIKNKNKK